MNFYRDIDGWCLSRVAIYNLRLMTRSEATDSLVRCSREFYARGWMLGTSGNLSAVVERDPLRLAITESSVDKGRLTADHILLVDGSGQVVADVEGGRKSSAETLLHLEVIRLSGAAAVFHTHSVWSTILSDYHAERNGMLIEGFEMLKGLEGVHTHEHREWLPIVDNNQDMRVLAAAAQAALEKHPAAHGFLVRRHGLYTWGKDAATAARHVEILEFLLESTGRRQMMESSR